MMKYELCVLLGGLLHVFVHPCFCVGVKEDLITRLLTHYESVSVGRVRVLCHISMVWAFKSVSGKRGTTTRRTGAYFRN